MEAASVVSSSKYLDEKMRPRADASAGPPSLRTLAMLLTHRVVIFLAGLFVMAPLRIRHPAMMETEWETPAEALSFGFWLASVSW